MTHPFAANAQGFIDTCNTPETTLSNYIVILIMRVAAFLGPIL